MANVAASWREQWSRPAGFRDVLAIGYPLILSQLSYTLQTFVDRLFLTWYSPEAVAGAVAGVFLIWSVVGLFIGTGEYLTAFIGQYVGARRPERIGVAIWQGFYFSLLAGAVCLALTPLVGPALRLAGHPQELFKYEVEYASIILGGAGLAVMMATLSTFFAGRGQTRVILLVNVLATIVNVALDWWWIFDRPGRPGYGVAGAAYATLVSQAVGVVAYALLILRRQNREGFGTLRGWRPERALLTRVLRFGLPTGMQYSTEILAFAIFILLIGRLGTVPLAASSIAFGLNMIVFMPMLGLGVGVSALVARHLGADRPELAERATFSALGLSLVYMLICSSAYVLVPHWLLAPYAAGSTPELFGPVAATTTVLLRYVALYSIFDMFNVIFASGLKGAGDTTYPFKLTFVLSWVVLLLPTYLACEVLGMDLYAAWSVASVYVFCLGLQMWRRFRRGGWKLLRVIEHAPAPVP